MKTPRPSAASVVDASDLRTLQTRKYEGLLRDKRLTQDTLQTVMCIIDNAMMCGQSHARIQLLHATENQYHYAKKEPAAVPLCDALTLQPVDQRIVLGAPARALADWVCGQGMQCVYAAFRSRDVLVFGAPALAPHVYMTAVFVPAEPPAEPPGEPPSGGSAPSTSGSRCVRVVTAMLACARLRRAQRTLAVLSRVSNESGRPLPAAMVRWNTQYMYKCLDDSAIPTWNARCANAMRTGASHFAVCTLYRHCDYDVPAADGAFSEMLCAKPLHHLSMTALDRCGPWVLEPKMATLVAWVHQHGFEWTLTMPDSESEWAYFVVMLDPVERFY